MSKTISGKDVIRAWKDAEYRESLSAEERAALPNHPAGLVDLSEAELELVRGAIEAHPNGSIVCPTHFGATCVITTHTSVGEYTFAAPDPRDGCQNSVGTWTCRDIPGL
jgi:mersacidin/lichenicidin family type 2 lantibiotic